MDPVAAPVGYTRTESGRRSGAFAIFMAFAVTPEVFDRVGEYLERRVAEDTAEKARRALNALAAA